MLRMTVIALAALNLLLFTLEASKAPDTEAPAGQHPTAAQPDEAVPEIRLLGELAGNAEATMRPACFTVGPFGAAAEMEAALSALEGVVQTVSSHRTEEEVERGFWVYLPPLDTPEAAAAMARTMKEAGMTDVNVIGSGEWGRSISLGYFLNESNALAHRDAIRELGFDAQIRAQRETEARFWVDYAQRTGSRYASLALSGTLDPGLHRRIPCASVGPGQGESGQAKDFRPF